MTSAGPFGVASQEVAETKRSLVLTSSNQSWLKLRENQVSAAVPQSAQGHPRHAHLGPRGFQNLSSLRHIEELP